MSRFLIVVVAILASFSLNASTLSSRYFLVPTDNLEFFHLDEQPVIQGSGHGLSLVSLSPRQVEVYSTQAHKRKNVCGGLLDAQLQMDQFGMSPEQLLRWAYERPLRLQRFPHLTPSYPTQVEKLMGATRQDRFGSFLKELTSFPDRSATTELGVKASQFLASRGEQMAQTHKRSDITVQTIPTRAYNQPSVLIRIKGQDPKAPGVLIGGHMDTFNDGKPGADDDGSGTATVMEIYNAVLDTGLKFKRDLYLAFYAAEERGLHGSQAMVIEFKKRQIPMRAILQFDMTGFKSPRDTQEIYFITDHVDTNLTQFLINLTETYVKIPAKLIGKTACGYSCSDHASWTNGGYSSAFPFEASFENYNKTLHTGRDTMELITPAHVMKFVKLGAAFAAETAEPID